MNEKRSVRRRLMLGALSFAVLVAPGIQMVRTATTVAACGVSVGGLCEVPSASDLEGTILNCQTGPNVCPNPVGDAQMVIAEVGPARSDPIQAVDAARQAGLIGVPTTTTVEQLMASNATQCLSGCATVADNGSTWTHSYAAVEWCQSDAGGGCDAWHAWVKGEVHWNGYQVWEDWADCSDYGAGTPYSITINWCGAWNNGGGNGYNFMDLGENWTRTANTGCCQNQQSYWDRIDIYIDGSHNFRGGGGS